MVRANKEEQRKAPILRFKGFTDDWEQRQLSNVIKLMGGNAFKGSSAVKEGIPWLKITNVGKNGINWNTQFYLPFSFWDKWPNYQLFSGDYVMALTRPVLDHTLKIGKMDRKALLNQRVSKLEFSFDKEFTFQLLQRKKTVIEIEKELAGSDPPNLGSKNLKNIKIFLSIDPDEQKRIGLLFRCLDNLLALYERKVKLLSQVKKYFLDNLFAEKECPNLRFKGFTDAWEQRKLGEVSELNGRIGFRGYTAKDIISKENGGILTFSPTNITNNSLEIKSSNTYITKEKYEESPEIQVNNGDILFVKTGSTLGKNTLVSGLMEPATINPQIVIIRSQKYGVQFLSVLLMTNYIQKQITAAKIGGAVPTLTESEIKKFIFYIPNDLNETEKIGQFFSKLDSLIALYEDKQQHLTEIKNTLLNTMFI